MAKRGAIAVGKEVPIAKIEMDIKIGAMLACEWTLVDIALHFGITEAAIRHRTSDRYPHCEVIPHVRTWVRLAIDKYIADRIRAAEEDIREMKANIHKGAYKLVKKTIDHGNNLPEDRMPDPVHLRAAEMGIERTEGKPLDRKAIMTRNENVTVRQVDGGELDELLREVAEINLLRKPTTALLEGVRDAEVV